jgi:hypothetical protein
MTGGATVQWSYHRHHRHATGAAGALTTNHQRRKKVYQGVRKGEAMTAASLASSDCSPTVNSGRLECPRHRRQEQRKGEEESELGRLGLGPWLRPGSAQTRRREKRGREREQLGRDHSWAASVAGPDRERLGKEISFSIF